MPNGWGEIRSKLKMCTPAGVTATLVFTFSILIRIPFTARTLINWDAVQFALGTIDFNPTLHQPHPPGYFLYILWGRLLDLFTGDPNGSFVLTSVLASSGAVVLFYLLAREIVGERWALISSFLFSSSPLLWYYSEVALTYSVEAFFALLIAYMCWQMGQKGNDRLLIPSAIVLGIAGGVRQSTLFFMLPLWVFTVRRAGGVRFLKGIMVLGSTFLGWFIPMLYLSGGPFEYFRSGLLLTGVVAEMTSLVMGGGLEAFLRNLFSVVGGLAFGLGLGTVVLLVLPLHYPQKPLSGRGWPSSFFVLWLSPALLVFVLAHIGQWGYLLLVLPVFFVMLARALGRVSDALRPTLGLRPIVLLVAGLFLANGSLFLLFPEGPTAKDIQRTDQFWKALPQIMSQYSPEETAVFTGSIPNESFRHASYYLPRYYVYGLGVDRRGRYGHLFTSKDFKSNYSLDRLINDQSNPSLRLPPHIRYVVFIDRVIAASAIMDSPLIEIAVTPQRSVYLSRSDFPTQLVFYRDKILQIHDVVKVIRGDEGTRPVIVE